MSRPHMSTRLIMTLLLGLMISCHSSQHVTQQEEDEALAERQAERQATPQDTTSPQSSTEEKKRDALEETPTRSEGHATSSDSLTAASVGAASAVTSTAQGAEAEGSKEVDASGKGAPRAEDPASGAPAGELRVGDGEPPLSFASSAQGSAGLGLLGTGVGGGGGAGGLGAKGTGRAQPKSKPRRSSRRARRGAGRGYGSSARRRRPWRPSPSQLRDQLHGYPSAVNHEPLSTFSMDVDRTSFTRVRSALTLKKSIPASEVKVEGFINAFPYQLEPPPTEAPEPFSLTAELSDSPNSKGGDVLLRVALKAKELPSDQRPQSNLVLLVDVSGSMCARGKLTLVKKSLTQLTKQLKPTDKMSLVTYSGRVRTLLSPTLAEQKSLRAIRRAINSLRCAGKTAGGAGLERAYELAQEGWVVGGNNRVIVATDGDFNMGISSVGEIKRLISEKRTTGVYLSMLGFGYAGYNDKNMGTLARAGNGNYAFIDSVEEAERVLDVELAGTLSALATNLKLQVEFNPEHVQSYRLLGYERRRMSASSFRDDSKDAAELGAGQQVTALYELYTHHKPSAEKLKVSYPCGDREVTPNIDCPDRKGDEGAPPSEREVAREWGVFRVRYQTGVDARAEEVSYPIQMGVKPLSEASHDHRVATSLTLLGEALKSKWWSFKDVARNRDLKDQMLFFRGPYTQRRLLALMTPSAEEELGPEQERALKGLQSMVKSIYKLMR